MSVVTPSQDATTAAIPPLPGIAHTDVTLLATMREMAQELIAFNKLLGLELTGLSSAGAQAHLRMKPELVGHYASGRIHGGAISAALDTMGGIAIMGAMAARYAHEPLAQQLQRFGRIGTIDLRVDYLRAGLAPAFDIQAQVLRLGSRVANTRMDFYAADGTLLATASAAYIVS